MNNKRNLVPLEKGHESFTSFNGYIIVIEPTQNGFSAFCPALSGCITVGKTVEQTKINMQEAIELYLEELLEMNEKIPEPKNLKEHIIDLENSQSDVYIAFIPMQINGVHAKSA